VLRAFSSEGPGGSVAGGYAAGLPSLERAGTQRLAKMAGAHRFLWDMRLPGAWHPDAARSGASGPLAVPGKYQARLTVGDWTQTRAFELRMDPRVVADGVTQADLEEQLDFNLQLRDAIGEARMAAEAVAEARGRLVTQEGSEAALGRLNGLHARLTTAPGTYQQPMLVDQLSNIYRMTNRADQKIGRDAFVRFEDLRKELADIQAELRKLTGTTNQPAQ
jgi:hypothetical protein